MVSCRMKFLKFCCITTVFLLLITAATLVALYFTFLKPKKPGMVMQPVTLDRYRLTSILPPVHLVKLGVTVMLDNRNYGSFEYDNGTTYVTYRGTRVEEAPIEADTFPVRAKHNISTAVNLSAEKSVSNPGWLDLMSLATPHGQVKVLKLFKMKSTTFRHCC